MHVSIQYFFFFFSLFFAFYSSLTLNTVDFVSVMWSFFAPLTQFLCMIILFLFLLEKVNSSQYGCVCVRSCVRVCMKESICVATV